MKLFGSSVPQLVGTPETYKQIADEQKRDAQILFNEHAKGRSQKGVVFFGNVGTGKTQLATRMLVHYLYRSQTIIWIEAQTLLSQLQSNKFKDVYISMISVLKNVDVLLIDDLCSPRLEELKPTALSMLREVIDARHRSYKRMIITSNVDSMTQFAQLTDHALVSRLEHCCDCVFIGGRDLRSTDRTYKIPA